MDLEAYDGALLALQQELLGGPPGSAAELPLLPVAPWNRRPGYLVGAKPSTRMQLSL